MLFWFPVMTLMVEAARVIEMRLQMIALGQGTSDEMFLMVTEKVDAMEQAKKIIVRGGEREDTRAGQDPSRGTNERHDRLRDTGADCGIWAIASSRTIAGGHLLRL